MSVFFLPSSSAPPLLRSSAPPLLRSPAPPHPHPDSQRGVSLSIAKTITTFLNKTVHNEQFEWFLKQETS
jgi:hypothetical protein